MENQQAGTNWAKGTLRLCRPHPARSARALERADHGAFAPEGLESMAFNDDYGSPQQPALVTAALEVFCKEAGIEPDSYEYDVARDLIESLYRHGATTSVMMVAAIENMLRHGEERH
jgi:hypothetical protein